MDEPPLDKAVARDVKPWDGAIMASVLIDVLPSLRLEALAEIGRSGMLRLCLRRLERPNDERQITARNVGVCPSRAAA